MWRNVNTVQISNLIQALGCSCTVSSHSQKLPQWFNNVLVLLQELYC